MELDSRFPQIPEKSRNEDYLEKAKSIVDIFGFMIPGFSSALSVMLDKKISKMRGERFNSYINSLQEKISSLPDEILSSDKFNDAIFFAISNYMKAPSEKERIFIAHLNESFLLLLSSESNTNNEKKIHSTFDLFYVFSNMFEQLSLPTIDCLIHFIDKFPKSGATRYDILQYFNELQGIHGKRALNELLNNALIEEVGSSEMPPSFNLNQVNKSEELPIGQRKCAIQPLGALFSDWLQAKVGKNK